MNQSNFLRLNWNDFGKGLIMAVLTPVVLIIQESVSTGTLTFNWNAIGISAIAGGVAYLIKNLFTAPQA